MKKVFCLILTVLLLCALLPGCTEKEPEKLRVCFDAGIPNDLTLRLDGKSLQEEDVKSLLSYIDNCDRYIREGVTSEDIEVEIIPSDETKSTEREAALQRVRTEIMTGGGPDVFVCKADADYLKRERLFPYVEKAIGDGLFLPMDELMERAVLTNFSDQCAPVLEGGKDKDGHQVVIPMTYAINVDIYRKEDLPSYDAAGKTWEDVLTSEDPLLASQAGWIFGVGGHSNDDSFLHDVHQTQFLHAFSDLMDFEAGKLTMTEEELTAEIKKALAAYRGYLGSGKELQKSSRELWPATSSVLGEEDMTFVPMRNSTGGTTAEVTMFCAINKNTKQPERSFEVIDAFLSQDAQRYELYEHSTGMSLNRKIMSKELPFSKIVNFRFTEQQYEEYQKAIDQIDAVYFPSPLDIQLEGYPESLFEDLQNELLNSFGHGETAVQRRRPEVFLKGEISDEKLSEIVHTYYEKMERLLDES